MKALVSIMRINDAMKQVDNKFLSKLTLVPGRCHEDTPPHEDDIYDDGESWLYGWFRVQAKVCG